MREAGGRIGPLPSSSPPSRPSWDAPPMPDRTHGKEIALHRERCFLCGVVTPERAVEGEDPLGEIARLIDTAGGMEAGRLTQRLDRAHPKTYFGKGKLAELVDAAGAAEADTIVVDDALAPKQLSAIEEACSLKVIDRNEVIIDIFQARARSRQAKLQVELAQLQYELPRLARKWTHLERLGGGIGTRGPGESQIETDRRLLRQKIARLRTDLEEIENRKQREVRGRGRVYSVCLVGYTNAGKSSLLNRLTGAGAFVEDRLFATLDTLTRRLDLGDGDAAILSDTIGFIRRLPHHLVASFHATLAEAAHADLLLHVVDASDPVVLEYVKSVNDTLASIGLGESARMHVLNKLDAVGDVAALDGLRRAVTPPTRAVSAKTGEGMDALLADLKARVRAHRRHTAAMVCFPASDGRLYAAVNAQADVASARYDGDDCYMEISAPDDVLARLEAMAGGRWRVVRAAAADKGL